jgi:phosphoribosylamine--glycine ligase
MAQQKAYAVADQIQFAGKQLRRDIGGKALNRHK